MEMPSDTYLVSTPMLTAGVSKSMSTTASASRPSAAKMALMSGFSSVVAESSLLLFATASMMASMTASVTLSAM